MHRLALLLRLWCCLRRRRLSLSLGKPWLQHRPLRLRRPLDGLIIIGTAAAQGNDSLPALNPLVGVCEHVAASEVCLGGASPDIRVRVVCRRFDLSWAVLAHRLGLGLVGVALRLYCVCSGDTTGFSLFRGTSNLVLNGIRNSIFRKRYD
jgi:hypothetical protein